MDSDIPKLPRVEENDFSLILKVSHLRCESGGEQVSQGRSPLGPISSCSCVHALGPWWCHIWISTSGDDAKSGLWPRSWFFRAQARPLLQLTETFLLQEVLELAFSILYDPDETLNFIAPNKYEVSRVALPQSAEPSLGGAGRIAMSP